MKLRFFQDLLHKCVAKLENQIFHFFVDFLTTNLQCNSLDNIADEVVFVTIESRMTLKFVNLNFNCVPARFSLRFKHKDSKGQSLAGQKNPQPRTTNFLNSTCDVFRTSGFPFLSAFHSPPFSSCVVMHRRAACSHFFIFPAQINQRRENKRNTKTFFLASVEQASSGEKMPRAEFFIICGNATRKPEFARKLHASVREVKERLCDLRAVLTPT